MTEISWVQPSNSFVSKLTSRVDKRKILYAKDDDLGAERTRMILEKQDFLMTIAAKGAIVWKMYKDGIEVTRKQYLVNGI